VFAVSDAKKQRKKKNKKRSFYFKYFPSNNENVILNILSLVCNPTI